MIELNDVRKTYQMGETTVHALQGVDLTIQAGDFVAIMGPSGSGKSTLMHVLGLLDAPDGGSYRLEGREVSGLTEDELALLRRETVGFVFQQFHLLPRMSALENTILPQFYSRDEIELGHAKELLDRVGILTRASHRPNELSGGQQQRVAIARALVNRPRIIMADEPTGNLDSKSEEEIMALLKELNAQGITIILVTHEEEIGKQARRLIRMRDGKIQSDERLAAIPKQAAPEAPRSLTTPPPLNASGIWEHFKQGFKTLAANKVRTALSMLGILIGVASVIAMLALGSGAQQAIESQLSSLGSNLLVLRPGGTRVGGVAQETGTARINLEDAAVLKEKIPAIVRASPSVSGRAQVVYGNQNWNTQLMGTTTDYADMRGSAPAFGRFFTDDENKLRQRVAVVGQTIVNEVFAGKNPLGETIKLNRVNFQVIGVLPAKGATGWRDQDDVVVVPIGTAMRRVLGKDNVDSIDVQVDRPENMGAVQDEMLRVIMATHNIPFSQRETAFQVRNMADVQKAMFESSRTMSVLLAVIAGISLLVGGIGIMNIMLVSVTERTREIGLRKAVGARRQDISTQFLAESVVVSGVGGMLGVILGWLVTLVLSIASGWNTSISVLSVALAFFFSTGIGVVFGIYPAKKAARLNPIEALRTE